LYGARLVELLDGRLTPDQLAAAEDSVGVGDALGNQVASVAAAVDDAFLVGLSAGCLVIGVLCLLGALAALIALPGTRTPAVVLPDIEAEPVNER
jgi:hypothetical protein